MTELERMSYNLSQLEYLLGKKEHLFREIVYLLKK